MDLLLNNLAENDRACSALSCLRIAAVGGLLLSLSITLTAGASGPVAPGSRASGSFLGSARPYAVLSALGVSNKGKSIVYGDVGTPGEMVASGFPPGVVFAGSIHRDDTVVRDAQLAAFTAYKRLIALRSVPIASIVEGNLGGLRLLPGVYAVNQARLNGTLQLDTLGKEHAVFVFQIGNTLTTTRNAAVVMENGGLGEAVYWQVGGSAKLDKGTHFTGNILAEYDIVIGSGAKIRCGRAFSLTGTVAMDTDSISTACESRELPLPGIATTVMGGGPASHPTVSPVAINASPEPGTFWLAAICMAGFIAFQLIQRARKRN
jgi:hypothetical protein